MLDGDNKIATATAIVGMFAAPDLATTKRQGNLLANNAYNPEDGTSTGDHTKLT